MKCLTFQVPFFGKIQFEFQEFDMHEIFQEHNTCIKQRLAVFILFHLTEAVQTICF